MKINLRPIGLLLIACVVSLSGSAWSQSSRDTATPPPYCHPCLFYGGDFDESNPSANALSNSFVGSRQFSAVYVPFVVPKAQVWTVTGFFSNNMSNTASLDPPLIKWSISSGVSAGHAGTVIAQGTAHATYTPTGRSWSGLSGYTTLGHLTPQTVVTLAAGVYWMTAVPMCTDLNSCHFAGFWLSDVEDVPAPNHKGIEPNDDSFFLAPTDGWFFYPTAYPNGVCNGGGNGTGCDKFSAGLLGVAKPAQ